METGQDREEQRPDTALTPPPVDCADKALLTHLLKIELQRLRVAQQIEIDRETVFPETSVIIRDVNKLHGALAALRGGIGISEETEVAEDGELEALLREVT